MSARNMWIGETGRERGEIPGHLDTEGSGGVVLDPATEVQSTSEAVQADEVNPVTESPLAVSGIPLDDLVPRSWRRW